MARRLAAAVVAGTALALQVAPVALADGDFSTSTAPPLVGLASDADRGVYWTAARNSPTVYALGPDGKQLGQVGLDEQVTDVEAVTYRNAHLYVGDIGGSRERVNVLRIGSFGYGSTVTPRVYTLAYPDGAHDSGAMAVSHSGRIYLVTRGSRPGIYRTSTELASGGTTNELTRVADAPANVTDATFSADGNKLVLRTLTGLVVINPYTITQTAAAPLGTDQQGLAVTTPLADSTSATATPSASASSSASASHVGTSSAGTAVAGTDLVVSGQGSPTPLFLLAMPTSNTTLPPAPASPAVPSSTPAPSKVAHEVVRAADPPAGHALAALVAAGAISLLAAVVVVVKR